ncbi:hypothetical protein EBZ37_06835 [bacterium]|nr:hypothetical protein [bacterium]
MRHLQAKLVVALMAVSLLVTGLAEASDPELDSRPVYQVLTLASAGAAAGLGAGLVLWPISGRFNTVPVGLGVGACLGVAVGLFHVTHADDPQNPLVALGVDLPQGVGERSPVALSYTLRF